MKHMGNKTGFVLLDTSVLAQTALETIRLRIALQKSNSSIMEPVGTSQLQSMRAGFLDDKLPQFLENAIFEGDVNTKCSRLTTLVSGTPVGQIIQAYLQPVVIIFTLITNCVTAIVLTRPILRNPTNTLLLGIAIADLLTVLLPLPIYISSLTSNLYREQLTLFKGYAVSYLTTLLPTIFHTAAIWMTVLLAVQRFVYVQYPLKANSTCICQPGPIKWSTLLTVILALLFQLPQMIFLRYHNAMSFHVTHQITDPDVVVLPSRFGPIVLGELGVVKCTPLDPRFMFTLLLCRVAFVHVIPSVLLTILTGQLIVALHRFASNRRKLLNKFKPSGTEQTITLANSFRSPAVNGNKGRNLGRRISRINGASSSETDSTSRMMLVVLGIFLLVELPTTACICSYAFSIILNREVSGVFFWIMELCNFLVVLSYPANFFVYLAMSRPFRETLRATFPWCWNCPDLTHSKCNCLNGRLQAETLHEHSQLHLAPPQPINVG